MEEHLLDNRHDKSSFTDAIVRCLTLSKANAFENILEPLQKLLRLSPPVASTFARPDLFTRLRQKLHHNKAAVRLNLLRIISSICDSTEQQGGLLATYGLLDAIRELENDPAILVRDMAGKLIQSNEHSDSFGLKRRPTSRRKSTSTTPPNPFSSSTPSTPSSNRSSQSRPFYEGRETPRHPRNALSGSSLAMRPGSRDGNVSALASAANGSSAAARPRIARGMSNRLSYMESMQDDDAKPPTLNRRPSVIPRRRRPTSVADAEWTGSGL